MFKLLLKFCVCVSMACHSAILPNFTNFDMQDVIKSEFDVNFKQLKRDYLDRISQLKEEAINCTPTGTHFNANEKIGLLNKAFHDQAKNIKDLHKHALKMFDRRYHVKCIDCISDYFEEIFSDFCDILDYSEENPGANTTASATNLIHTLETLRPFQYLNSTTSAQAMNQVLSDISQAFRPTANVTIPY